MEEQFVTAPQVAEYLGVSLKTIRGWTSIGMLPAYRVNRSLVRYRLTEVEEWFAKFHQKGRLSRRLPVSEDKKER